jgi:E3 ubiquitin-protein ligase MARCH6
VLAFLAVFLLREWIQQNARPGVFDDGPVVDEPIPVDLHPQLEPGREEADDNQDGRAEIAAEWTPGVDETAAPTLPLLRPVPDVPEDVRPAGPSSLSSSSSDTEAPLLLPATRLEDPLPLFGRRRREIPKRKLRGVSANRKLHIMEEDDHDVERSRRVKREKDEPSHWEIQPDQLSGSQGSSGSGLYALEDGPQGSTVDSHLVDEGIAEGTRSGTMFESGSKTRQKRKASDSDTEFPSRDSSTPNSPSPASADFEFTFKPPPFRSDDSSNVTFAIPHNGEFKLNPRTRPSSPILRPSIPSQSSSQRLTPDVDTPLGAGTLPSTYSGPTSHSAFEPPPSAEPNCGPLVELPYPLTPRSVPPTSPSSSSLFSEDLERKPFQLQNPPLPPDSPSTPSRSVLTPRRPSLPTSTLPAAEHVNAEASSSTAGTVALTPLPSPHLATYRPPEELEVEDEEYFGTGPPLPEEHGAEEEEDEEEEDDTRFAYYFQEHEQDDTREVPPPLLPDTDDEDDEEDGRDGGEPREGVNGGPPGDAPPAARDVGGQDMDVEAAEDERDQNLEEDLDGAMEGIYQPCVYKVQS